MVLLWIISQKDLKSFLGGVASY